MSINSIDGVNTGQSRELGLEDLMKSHALDANPCKAPILLELDFSSRLTFCAAQTVPSIGRVSSSQFQVVQHQRLLGYTFFS